MSKKAVLCVAVVAAGGALTFLSAESEGAQTKKPGLLGVKYGRSNFEGLDQSRIIIKDLNKEWSHSSEDYSCRWFGYIVAPSTGSVNFIAEADNGSMLKVDVVNILKNYLSNEEYSHPSGLLGPVKIRGIPKVLLN